VFSLQPSYGYHFLGKSRGGVLTKEDLIALIKKILRTDLNLVFLMKLEPGDLETLIACIRNGLEPKKK